MSCATEMCVLSCSVGTSSLDCRASCGTMHSCLCNAAGGLKTWAASAARSGQEAERVKHTDSTLHAESMLRDMRRLDTLTVRR